MKLNQHTGKSTIRWVLDDDRILLGPDVSFAVGQLSFLSIGLKIIGAVLVVVAGSELIIANPMVMTLGMFLGFAIFLFGTQLSKVLREAKEEMSHRTNELRVAKDHKNL